jgi:endonuclease YncB( thermonuclease family)
MIRFAPDYGIICDSLSIARTARTNMTWYGEVMLRRAAVVAKYGVCVSFPACSMYEYYLVDLQTDAQREHNGIWSQHSAGPDGGYS